MSKSDLTFSDWQENIKTTLGKTEWITALSTQALHPETGRSYFFSALISDSKVDDVLKDCSWDLQIGHGFPGYITHYQNEGKITEYHRFPDEGIEPLVYWRDFHGIKEIYYEISEEFRLFFNLYEDRKSLNDSKFIYFDSNGDEHEAVLITPNEVKVKLKFLKEFLFAKKMHLAIYFDFMRFSDKTINELKQPEIRSVFQEDKYIYSICVIDCGIDLAIDKTKSQGWLHGKKLIAGLENHNHNTFGCVVERKYEDFIIGIDENGDEIFHTCEEGKLSDYFGKNPGSPNYMTPVIFKRDVLKKYYDNPDKYTVDDGRLSCKDIWGMRIDNNHQKYVMVFLGDLGHLNYKEQNYWKSFNIPDQGGISRVAYERGVKGQFTDPDQPDLYFKQKLSVFQKRWFGKYGWYLFKPLSKGDAHHLKSLHIPTTNDQKEFDEQVLSLAKIILESLNEKELSKDVSIEKGHPKSIDIFEAFLESKNIHLDGMFEFIRNLQSLRSTFVAHRKSERSKDYKKVRKYFEFDKKDNQEIFEDIMVKTIWMLNSLEEYLLREK